MNSITPKERHWQPYTLDFDYVKDFYEVRLPSGQIVAQCWPNAGWMNATDGSGRKWGPADNVQVRIDLKNALGED